VRILCVNNVVDSKLGGGTATRTKQLCSYLAYKSYTVELLSLHIGDLEDSSKMLENVKATLLKVANRRFFVPKISEFHKIESAVINSDCIHLMSHWTFINVITAYYARKHSVPYIICPAGALRIFGRSKILKMLFNIFFGNYLLHKANALIAINKDEEVEFKNNSCYNNQNIMIIPNGIDQKDYLINPSDNVPKLPDNKFILFLGRLNEIKGPDILFDSYAKISEQFPLVDLVFAGPDEGLQTTIENKAAKLGLSERIHFTGFLAHKAKIDALTKCYMMVIPSRKEAMSIVVLEGAMLKKPIIFTDECGVDDFEQNNIGISTKVSINEISTEMEKLLNSERLANKIGLEAYDFTIKNYSWDAIIDKHILLFNKTIENNR